MIFRRILGEIFNFIGGMLRWIFANIIATIFDKERFSLKEYQYGIENPESGYEQMLHGMNNYILGILFIILMIFIFS